MSFAPLQPPPSRSLSRSGIVFSRKTSARGDTATLTLNAQVQEDLFGQSVVGSRLEILVGRADDEGSLLIRLLEDGRHEDRAAHIAQKLMKGSVRVKLRPWDLLGEHEAAGEGCEIEQVSDRGIVLRLPAWCQPAARKARAAARLDADLQVQKGGE